VEHLVLVDVVTMLDSDWHAHYRSSIRVNLKSEGPTIYKMFP